VDRPPAFHVEGQSCPLLSAPRSLGGPSWPQGITGILLALRLCRHVHVFGFAATDYFDKQAWPHYYDHERPKPGREDVHPFAQEAQIYQMLQAAGKLTMHG